MGKECCVFCGEKIGMFGGEQILCAGIYQPCCKACAKETAGLSQEELCRRALQLGHAALPDQLRNWLATAQSAEENRPLCRHCGGKLTFRKTVIIHNTTPGTFEEKLAAACELQPAACSQCGRLEFFDPAFVRQNELLSHLVKKDTGKLA